MEPSNAPRNLPRNTCKVARLFPIKGISTLLFKATTRPCKKPGSTTSHNQNTVNPNENVDCSNDQMSHTTFIHCVIQVNKPRRNEKFQKRPFLVHRHFPSHLTMPSCLYSLLLGFLLLFNVFANLPSCSDIRPEQCVACILAVEMTVYVTLTLLFSGECVLCPTQKMAELVSVNPTFQ